MARFFLPRSEWKSAPVLSGDEARHLSQVLRIRAGQPIEVFDGAGRRAAATVLNVARDQVALELGNTIESAPSHPAITLAQAIPKGKNMDLIVQKAVELGVATIRPLVTRHTVVQPGDGKSDKWRRVALEACKQCGQDRLPTIFEPAPFEEWIREPATGMRLIASLAPGARTFRDVVAACPDATEISILIGPEGDFSEAETALALAAGFHPITLGAIVLRTETAALFCLSALRFAYQRMF
jgi:16S rRNA (uracil1498-N3)-methyltransferase